MQPKSLEWKEKESLFVVTWTDKHQTQFPLPFLRKHCPCATCRAETRDQDPLKLIQTDPGEIFRAVHIDPVGRYAVRISWADGHAVGIYSFNFLKDLSLILEPKSTQ